MKKNKMFIITLTIAMILLMSMFATAFAGEKNNSNLETNLFENGYTLVDPEGNVVYQPQGQFNIGGSVVIPANYTVYCNTDCWYDGGKMTFYVSLSGGGDVGYLDVSLWSPESYATELGSFSAVNGKSWYGKYSVNMDDVYVIDPGKYYKYALTNNLGARITVSSFTGIDD